MTENERLRVRELFSRAIELPPAERDAFLLAECASEGVIRAEVTSLLAYDLECGGTEHGSDFLKSPMVRSPEMTLRATESSPSNQPRGIPERIGSYRILRRHDEGGMGTVFQAEQDNPRRVVALKVIRSELVSPEVVKRFRHEAQILASLHHYGIAQVFEAGVSDDGCPFLAMEFISGVPLDEYVRSQKLGIRERLELICKVCDAVQHAHDGGIVHRDLKPRNILVDQTGQPKVLDFGVAHVTSTDLISTMSGTHTGQLLGTLRYMSPEQLSGSSKNIDGRSDVYSIGVIIFQILINRFPYELDRLPLHEVARVISEQEPDRLGSLDKRLRGDIENIVAKALEKDRSRRYAAAADLAADLRRNLRGDPIVARRIGTAERCWRWSLRNPFIAILVSLLAVILVLTTAGSLIVAEQMTRLARDEKRARELALVETYNARLTGARALRIGHAPGWRVSALRDLARLVGMDTARRDIPELRTEAAAALASTDIQRVGTLALTPAELISFAFGSDGRSIITVGKVPGLTFWGLRGPHQTSRIAELTVHDSRFDQLVCLPDDKGLLVGTTTHGVVFTDAHGVRTRRAPIANRPWDPIRLSIDRGGKTLAIAWSNREYVTVHEIETGLKLAEFPDIPFALSPDGRWIAREEKGGISLVPIRGNEPAIILGRQAKALAFAFSEDGRFLAAAFPDHTIVLWDVHKRDQYGMLRGHRERVIDISFAPDGEWIATTALDYTIRIWETRTCQNIATLPRNSAITRVKWSPQGEYLAGISHQESEVGLYEIKGRKGVQRLLDGHHVELGSVASHPKSQQVVTAGYDELMLWDLARTTPKPLSIGPNPGAATALGYSPDGSRIAVASWSKTEPGAIVVRDAESGKELKRLVWSSIIKVVCFDPKGQRIAFGDQSGSVVEWDPSSDETQVFATGSKRVSFTYLAEPRRILTHSDNALLLINLESGRVERTVDLQSGTIRKVLFDPRTDRAIVGFESGTISGVALPQLRPVYRLEGAHGASIELMELSRDAALLATSGGGHSVVLRDPANGERLLDLGTVITNLRGITFNMENNLIMVGSDSCVDVWNLPRLRRELLDLGLDW